MSPPLVSNRTLLSSVVVAGNVASQRADSLVVILSRKVSPRVHEGKPSEHKAAADMSRVSKALLRRGDKAKCLRCAKAY